MSRLRQLVDDGAGPGWTAVLEEADGRWHVWISSAPGGGTVGMLPFFKAVGSLVPAACGVLDLAGPARWVMTGGSVDLARHPEHSSVSRVAG